GGVQPFSPAIDPSGKFLYAVNLASSNVSAFTINPADGTLTSVGPPVALTNASLPFSLAVSASGRFVYVANRFDTNAPPPPMGVAQDGNVSGFAIDPATGALGEISGSPFANPSGKGSRAIAVDPLGRFVFVANEDLSNVSAYKVDFSSGA